jgi:hypothetical protein
LAQEWDNFEILEGIDLIILYKLVSLKIGVLFHFPNWTYLQKQKKTFEANWILTLCKSGTPKF